MRTNCLTVLAGACAITVGSAEAQKAVAPNTDVYTRVLQEFVSEDGKVRYAHLRADLDALGGFVWQIGQVSPRSHPQMFSSQNEKLAYWINAYNAIVLWAFAREYPEKRDRLKGLLGRGSFFYWTTYTVGGEQMSLAKIENGVIREEFDDPRIHFALVCASSSCPALRNRAYTAENLDRALETETRQFLNDDNNVKLNEETRVVTLSKIFDWYAKDFGSTTQERLSFIASFRRGGEVLRKGEWRIRYFDYDWSPNDAPDSTR